MKNIRRSYDGKGQFVLCPTGSIVLWQDHKEVADENTRVMKAMAEISTLAFQSANNRGMALKNAKAIEELATAALLDETN